MISELTEHLQEKYKKNFKNFSLRFSDINILLNLHYHSLSIYIYAHFYFPNYFKSKLQT